MSGAKQLPLRTALRIAWRESRSAPAKFLFVIAAVAIGAGSLVAVRGFSVGFRDMLLRDARTLMAADLTVRIFVLPTAEQNAAIERLERRGVRHTRVTETVSMVSSAAAPQPVLVSVKAVDPDLYPFYGSVWLEPPGTLAEKLRADAAVVSSDLLARLKVRTGESIRLGGQQFRIAAVVRLEPDRMTGVLNVGPRILISRAGLDRTGLIQPGSRAAQKFLFRIGPGGPPVGELRRTLQRAFPDAQIADYRETHPAITRGLNRATTFLSLVSLVALIVGALGVAMAMHSHLQQKMEAIAVMKCVGARSGQIVRIYLAQALLLGLAGSILGLGLAGLIQAAFPPLVARYFPGAPRVSFGLQPALEGLGVGLLATLLFTAPALLAIRRVRPAVLLRREMAEARPPWRERLANARGAIAAGAALAAGIAAIAAWLSESLEMGALFAGGLAASLAALSGIAWLLLRAVRLLLRSRRRLPVALRHGLANLYRPGNHAGAVLVALGVGVTFTLTIYLVQRSVMAQLLGSTPRGMPNVFLINVTERERDGLIELLRKQPGLQSAVEVVPSVAARLFAVNGAPIRRLGLQGPVRRYMRTRQVTWAARRPAHITILEGKWPDGSEGAGVSIDEGAARVLGIKPGSQLEWEASGRHVAARVTAIHRSDRNPLGESFEFILNQGALAGFPATYYGALRVRPADVPALQRAAYEAYPAVTVINAADVLAIVEEVVDQIALAVRFVSVFAILAGTVILASSVAGTRFRRAREVAVLKALGATRHRVAGIFSVEFLALGSVAGLMGTLLATAFAGLLLRRLLDAELRLDPLPGLATIVLTALVANAAGWLASFRVLRQRPLEVLREE